MHRIATVGDPNFSLLSLDSMGIGDVDYLSTDDLPAGVNVPRPAPALPPAMASVFTFAPPVLYSLSSTNAPRLWLQPELPGWTAQGASASGPMAAVEEYAAAKDGAAAADKLAGFNWTALVAVAAILWMIRR